MPLPAARSDARTPVGVSCTERLLLRTWRPHAPRAFPQISEGWIVRMANRLLVAVAIASSLAFANYGTAAAGPFTRLQVLLPGETAAPGTSSGKSGTALAQTVGVPFSVTVRACDNTWALVNTASDVVSLLASDASATLPAPKSLGGGVATFTVTLNAAGTFTIFGHDQTDATIPDGASSAVRTLVLQGFTFGAINQKNQNAGQPMSNSVQARDPGGNLVSGFNGWVRLKEITSYGDGRVSPDSVLLSGGQWSGPVTFYRADETSINRGNVNLYAFLSAGPTKNGTSDPFTVHPGPFARVQIIVPGQVPLPGSVSGYTGTPAAHAAGAAFPVNIYGTDAYWNVVPSGDAVRITSSDPAANTPQTATLANGSHTFSVTLNTVGTQTIAVTDQTNGSIQGMTSPGISVQPSSINHFAINTITTPQIAGVPVTVTIRGVDSGNNTVPNYSGDAVVVPNTGAGSVSPELITFTNGVWTGAMTFKGAGGAVSFSVSDFSAPPHTGASNSFVVQPGPFAGLEVLVPGETARGGTADGREGTTSGQTAGTAFQLTVRAVDAYWNLVNTVTDSITLGSTDAFAGMPARTKLVNGQLLQNVTLYRTGSNQIWASDLTVPTANSDTSSAFTVSGGPFARLLVLAPGVVVAPGTANGRAGTATDQSINYAFTVTVLACDNWYNPVTGVTDVVHLISDDPLATLPPNQALVNGSADMSLRLARGGYDQISVSDITRPTIPGSSTQVRAISSGFHLEAAVTPSSAKAGEPFTITVKVTNDAGSVIQEINSFVTLEVQNASTRTTGRGALLTTQFQLLQGQRSVSETYSFSEPIVIVARDDAGNAPATSNAITITPGVPTQILLTSNPSWVGGNKHAQLSARMVDAFNNGVPGAAMVFQHLSGLGSITPVDSLTDAGGTARADFLSGRSPGHDLIRASASGLNTDLDLTTAFVDPNAKGGTFTNYPNPFHPPAEGTTLAWKLDDFATVTLRLFTASGDLVLEHTFARATPGGMPGLNEWVWDGKNGQGRVVASGGYVALVEAQGTGETQYVIRRRIAVVR
jgi:hypothetical protein